MELHELTRKLGEAWTPEAGVAVAGVAGWTLLTWAAADLIGDMAWKAGTGSLLLGLVGYGFLGTIFRDGLYTLSVEDDEEN